jgi:1-deoxy-D-xylulose-5-phosphate reductoisomerase
MKTIVILGSTGSIGTNTLDIVDRFPTEFRVAGLTAGSNDALLETQIRRFKPRIVALSDPSAATRLRQRCLDLSVEILAGQEGLVQVASATEADLVVSACADPCGHTQQETYRPGQQGTDGDGGQVDAGGSSPPWH